MKKTRLRRNDGTVPSKLADWMAANFIWTTPVDRNWFCYFQFSTASELTGGLELDKPPMLGEGEGVQ